jgi:TPR repeat protein
MYFDGKGVPKDQIEALAWTNIAAAAGAGASVRNQTKMELFIGKGKTLAARRRSMEILSEIEAAKSASNSAAPKAKQP